MKSYYYFKRVGESRWTMMQCFSCLISVTREIALAKMLHISSWTGTLIFFSWVCRLASLIQRADWHSDVIACIRFSEHMFCYSHPEVCFDNLNWISQLYSQLTSRSLKWVHGCSSSLLKLFIFRHKLYYLYIIIKFSKSIIVMFLKLFSACTDLAVHYVPI